MFYQINTTMKKNIAVIMGGFTSESNISLKSGSVVVNHLDTSIYAVYPIHISKEKWVLVKNKREYNVNKNDFSVSLDNKIIQFDCVFNAIHGAPGEDGQLLSYFELLGIPHTSAPAYQMAITYNKRDCLSILKPYGIKTAIAYYLNLGDTINENEIVDKVGLPCFVKANKAGSSFGITKVFKIKELKNAIAIAFKEDSEVLIESFLEGTEVSVGVLNYKNETVVLPITEIVSENDFFDYEAKYQGKSQEITPARISKTEKENIKRIAKQIYNILKMKGFTRSEFILIDEIPFLLEINTVPGMTVESILPQQAAAAGISLKELFGNAVEMACINI